MSAKAKILFFDIETSPHEGGVWTKYDANVLYFTEYSHLLSFAYRWQGDSTIHCETMRGKASDRKLITSLHALFQEADILVAHNGDQFDIKKVTARMLKWKMPPTKTLTSVDTKKVAKAYFNFHGNSLTDLADYLGIGSKVQHTGIGLWRGCKRDDAKSWKTMERYNKQDVVLLEKVYNRMLPWIKNHPNISRILNPDEKRLGICPLCVSENVIKKGFKATRAYVQQQWNCNDCGHWFLTRKVG